MEITRGKVERAQKVIVYGPEGVGKTTFASKFPNPLFIDTENGSSHLDVARFGQPTSWQLLIQQTIFVRDNKPCSTLVIDSIDWAEKLCETEVLSKEPGKTLATFGGGYGAGYLALETEWGRYLNLLEEVLNKGIHIVGVAHSVVKEFNDPSQIGAYDRYEIDMQKKTTKATKEWADIILFANYDSTVVNVDGKGETKGKNKGRGSGERKMHTTRMPSYDAKNRLGLPEVMPFEYDLISKAFKDFQKDAPKENKPIAAVKSETVVNTPKEVKKAVKEAETVLPDTVGADLVNNIEAMKDAPYDDTGIEVFPKALQDLMRADKITLAELKRVIVKKGFLPASMLPEKYPLDFINGGLIAQWSNVRTEILTDENRLPF